MSTNNEYACPKDVYQQLAWNMTVAHAIIKAGYESVWQHLENPPIHDLDNFISYCICWTEFVQGHHDVEESYLFPHLEKKIDLSHEKEQHEAIDKGMDKVAAHLQEAKANHAKFDAGHIREVMASFKDVLFAHLDEEIVDIRAERLKAFSEEELKEMVLGLETESRKRGGLTTTLPFLITHSFSQRLVEIFSTFSVKIRTFAAYLW
ncbi:hypothetical protein Clacol_005407 [Clathrus columnatus]|uniref:Hemerythrin-like domain-containing protein n=1 Tax=Clathrus columnatus TaxID=1419009 RepID=A0AAV5AA09_9AGAM|nr:hypothetical protein Clacol_005407 [Clathrus columnatus]